MGTRLRFDSAADSSLPPRGIRQPLIPILALLALAIVAVVVMIRRAPLDSALAAGAEGRGAGTELPPTREEQGAAHELGQGPRRKAALDALRTTPVAGAQTPSEDPPPVPFVVYPKFRSASELEGDPHVNPDGGTLTDEARAELDQYLERANEILAAKQARITAETQAWGKALIENGISDGKAAGSQSIVPGTTRVGVVLQGRVDTVTVRPGDNAILDDMNTDLGAFVRDCWAHIALQFQGPPAPSAK